MLITNYLLYAHDQHVSNISSTKQGPPYLPQAAQLGGKPTVSVDVPISVVFLLLFICGAALNMTIFQVNRRKGHKFVLSAVCFGFCMARINANILRIVWAVYPDNTRLAIAASIFANAGVLLLYVVNLIFLQRLVRAHHPTFGWSRPLSWAFKFLYFSIFACLVMVITSVVYSFYTLDQSALTKIRDVRLFAGVFLAVLSFIPLPGTIICLLIPRSDTVDSFGQGSMRSKIVLVTFTAILLSLGACFRAGIGFLPMRPLDNPGWYNHKACFYCFSYVLELIVLFTYALTRMDRRFHIPNGSSAPGHYSNGVPGSEDPISCSSEEEDGWLAEKGPAKVVQ
jgi:hypothetical protein